MQSAADANAWIQLDELVVHRGGRPVLQGVSGTLRGQAAGLVGANGAGKSTLIATLLGVLTPKSGRVSVLGLDLPGAAMVVRARAGVMAEQAGVFPGGSAVDAVAFAGALTGLRWSESLRRAHRSLDALNVGEERYRPANDLSTGMRQRVKLAMCLVHDPEILVLDEPTIGLDPPARAELIRLIRDLRDQGRRILLSTHLLDEAEGLCDEILLLREGRVQFCGTTEGMVGRPSTSVRVRGTGIASLEVELRARGLRIASAHPESDSVVIEAPTDEQIGVLWACVAQFGAEVREMAPMTLKLEDAVVAAMEATE